MRKQIAFATLTPVQIDQIAEWLIQGGTYNKVRERIAQPAPDGFGLQISIRPLQTLYAKKMRLDKINSHIVQGRPLTLAQFDALNDADTGLSAEHSAEVHHAILEAAHELATERDNTPAQLLALQRLADFPERAALRAQRAELDLAKEQRAQEMHTHKIALDLRKEARQIEADASRKEIAAARLDLAERTLAFRQQQHQDNLTLAREKRSNPATKPATPPQSDHLGPFATNWKEVGERVRKQFGISEEEAARRAELRKTWKHPNPRPTPNPDLDPTLNPTFTLDPNPNLPPSPSSVVSPDTAKDTPETSAPQK